MAEFEKLFRLFHHLGMIDRDILRFSNVSFDVVELDAPSEHWFANRFPLTKT